MSEEPMECPKCGKKGFVRCEHSNDDVFQCVYCDYRHDLTLSTKSDGEDQSPFSIYLAVLTVLIVLAVVFTL
jgi:hypothetical protein